MSNLICFGKDEDQILIEETYFESLDHDAKEDCVDGKKAIFIPAKCWSLAEAIVQKQPYNELEITDLILDLYNLYVKFNKTDGICYIYDENMYTPDAEGAILGLRLEAIGRDLIALKKTVDDQFNQLSFSKDDRKTAFYPLRHYLDFIVSKLCNQASTRICQRIQKRAQSEPVVMDNPDQVGHLLNCQNGIINLHSKEFYEHSPEFLISHITNCNYDPNAKNLGMRTFLLKIMNSNSAYLRRFLQLRGQALDESLVLKAMEIDVGGNDCGKTTLNEVLTGVLGISDRSNRGYVCHISPQNLTPEATSGGSCTPALEMMVGAKMIIVPEPDGDYTPSSTQLKTLSGGGVIYVNPKHQKAYAAKANGLIVWETNYFFELDDPIIFDRGSAQIMPYCHQFKGTEKDPTIVSRLLESEEAKSTLLNYLIAGYDDLVKGSYQFFVTQDIVDMTQKYRKASDIIGAFIESHLTFTGNRSSRIKFCDVYRDYKYWCSSNGYKPQRNSSFERNLASRHILIDCYRNQKYLVGYISKS